MEGLLIMGVQRDGRATGIGLRVPMPGSPLGGGRLSELPDLADASHGAGSAVGGGRNEDVAPRGQLEPASPHHASSNSNALAQSAGPREGQPTRRQS